MTTSTFKKIGDIFHCELLLENGRKFIIPLRDDGYILATALCKAVGKKVNNWLRLKETKELTRIFSLETGLDENKLIKIKKGGGDKNNQGTWVHRILATNLGQWCSVYFTLQVSKWIEEWCLIKNNEEKYLKEIYNIKPDNLNDDKELQIQKRLQRELGGKIEVETEVGYIDLLTDNEIIEIKNGNNWKHAVGQILIYSVDYPNHNIKEYIYLIFKNVLS